MKGKREEAKEELGTGRQGKQRGQTGGVCYPQEDLSLTLEPRKQSQFLSLPPSLPPSLLPSLLPSVVLTSFLSSSFSILQSLKGELIILHP